MAQPHTDTGTGRPTQRVGIRRIVRPAASLLVIVIVGAWAALMLSVVVGDGSRRAGSGSSAGAVRRTALPAHTASPAQTALTSVSPSASFDPASLLAPEARPAPPITLTDPAGQPFTLASLRGQEVLVFFGYTHCPDVCPETVGRVGVAMDAYGPGVHAVFVTVDPERDTTAWLTQYSQALPPGFTALTGSANDIRATADAWGVKYARVDTGTAGDYSMSHTADVYLIDADGNLRASLPYGTGSDVMTALLRRVAAATPGSSVSASVSPDAMATKAPSVLVLQPEVVSSSVWAGQHSPVILSLTGPGGRLNDKTASVSVQLLDAEGAAVGAPVVAVAVQPPGLTDVSWVASMDIPDPRAWRFSVSAETGALPMTGTTGLVTALDQGATPALGSAAPTIHTPTLDDVGGVARAVTTDPLPDLRLSARSTSDALANHAPFVLVLDSTKFRVTSACGKALVMARYLLDRWPQVTFIHSEPFRYSVVTDTPVLDGTLADPPLTDVSTAWGLGSGPWDALSMPWIFIVDGNGTVRAKYQGVIGSEDVDVMLALIAQGS